MILSASTERQDFMDIDIIDRYGQRVIGGVDKQDIIQAINDESDDFTCDMDKMQISHNLSGVSVVAHKCVSKYFKPLKSYYRLDGASCTLVKTAMGINTEQRTNHDCINCLRDCIYNHVEILPSNKKRAIVNCNFL